MVLPPCECQYTLNEAAKLPLLTVQPGPSSRATAGPGETFLQSPLGRTFLMFSNGAF